MSDDFENPSWDTDDTDIGGDSGYQDEAAASAEMNDTVAKLISGDLTPDEVEVPEKGEGRQWKALGQSRFIDGSGKTDWTAGGQVDADEGNTEPAKPSSPLDEYATLYQGEIDQQKEIAESAFHEAHKNNQQLQEMFEQGLIDEQKFQELTHAEGVKAGQAMFQMQQAELMGYKIKEQREDSHAQLAEVLGDAWGSNEARAKTVEMVQGYIKEMDIPSDVLSEIEEPSVVRALVEAAQNHTTVSDQKDEIARLKGQVRRLSKAVKGRKEKQVRDASRGVKNEDTIEQVARLLEGKI